MTLSWFIAGRRGQKRFALNINGIEVTIVNRIETTVNGIEITIVKGIEITIVIDLIISIVNDLVGRRRYRMQAPVGRCFNFCEHGVFFRPGASSYEKNRAGGQLRLKDGRT